MTTVFVHRDGRTEQATSIDRVWLGPAAGVFLWVDLAAPSIPELLILSDTFAFHPLSVDDAKSAIQYPKVEAYDGYLYIILHGIDYREDKQGFRTNDVDFFLGPNYLVTVHDGRARAIAELREHCPRNPRILAEGPVSLFHRIVDSMVDHYRPEVDKLEERLDELEKAIFSKPDPKLVRRILDEKRQVAHLRRILTPQRDVIGRLARRDFVDITTSMSFHFRDVYDHVVRLADDAMIFQDRITGMLDAHLSNVSNRLNEVMKVLTVVATIFMPLTLLSGMYGMNLMLPRFPGGDAAQFWWLFGGMMAVVVAMLTMFRRNHWI
ncbi:MAG: magnesium and cobalt transport protein CorA [Acidobacteria bacterium RIFCSPLOWO2_12_FULL_65_11]|nr:MAG: magnesium and cobalt transport protein CorA [Acidobacteria bacterium RIFCSPLOWO2_02_FULL_64_15]OFW28512.1 MAG: magnesium and cobalt transport protein CorA [Acidobacteria bacterium RIFCSPLOWO2_12_FULL_65_11]